MENKLKAYLSIASIILFGLAAMASFGPDASTNTSVAISNCMSAPPISGTVQIAISYKEKNGNPIPNASGTVYIWRQETPEDGSCKAPPSVLPFNEDIFTDAFGTFFIGGYNYTFNNTEDLHRVEVIIDKSAIFNGCRIVKVQKYSNSSFVFNCVGIRLNEL